MNANEKIKSLEKDFMIPMTQEPERKVSDMCNVSQGIYEEGVKDGLSQSLSQGEKRGEKRGRTEATKMIAVNMADLNIPMEKIAEATQQSISVIRKWIEEHKAAVSG
jgi:hypothetical protein